MADHTEELRRRADRYRLSPGSYERLLERQARRNRNRRITSAAVTVCILAAVGWGAFAIWPSPSGERVLTADSVGDLRRVWVSMLGGNTQSPPAEEDGTVFVATSRGVVMALNESTGAIRWTAGVGEPISAGPVASAGTVFVVSETGKVIAFSAIDGRRLWTARTDATGPCCPPPPVIEFAPTDDALYVGSRVGPRLFALDPGSGRVRWVARTKFVPSGLATSLRQPLVYVASPDGIEALFARTGEVSWSDDGPAHILAPTAGDALFSATEVSNLVRALDPTDGTVLWRATLPGRMDDGVVAIASEGGSLVVARESGSVAALDPKSGRVRWRTSVAGASQLVVSAGVVYTAGDDVHALDAATGRVLWSRAVSGSGRVAVDARTLYVASVTGTLTAYRPA